MSESGIFLVRKPIGMTSYDVIRIFKKKFHISKIGHAGTLDPFASGLLIVAINEGTKIIPFLENESKEYIAELTLGKETDSLDVTGNIIKEKKCKSHSKEEISKILNSFKGVYMQTPPIFSALKYKGQPLYKYARKNIELKINSREQFIYDIKLIKHIKNKIIFYVKCNKGTYIRSLGKDIAIKLNELGYLSNLERIGIGKFYILCVKKPECITMKDLIKLEDALPFKKIDINNNEDLKKIKNGCAMKLNKSIEDENILFTYKNKALAIYSLNKNDMLYYSKRGFNEDGNI